VIVVENFSPTLSSPFLRDKSFSASADLGAIAVGSRDRWWHGPIVSAGAILASNIAESLLGPNGEDCVAGCGEVTIPEGPRLRVPIMVRRQRGLPFRFQTRCEWALSPSSRGFA